MAACPICIPSTAENVANGTLRKTSSKLTALVSPSGNNLTGGELVEIWHGVPRLTVEYHRNRSRMFSAAAADSPPRNVDAIVIHRAYFPTVESIKASRDLATFSGEPAVYREGDRIVELRTVFVLLRAAKTKP